MKKFAFVGALLLVLNLVAAVYGSAVPTNVQPAALDTSLTAPADPGEADTSFQDGGYSAVLDRLGIPHQTIKPDMEVDLSGWPEDGAVNGPEPKQLHGERAGMPANALPGVRFISMGEAREMDVTRLERGGLFLVDIEFVPRELPEILERKELRLGRDGTLMDQNQEPVVAFYTSEVYVMSPEYEQRSQAEPLSRFFSGLADVLVPAAEAAWPFAWRCYSFSPSAWYHGGFHRWYEADTWTGAYGADGSGGCSWSSPYTHIDYQQARAAVGGGGSYQHCFNCEREHAHDEWDVGYFWPAHGVPTTTHTGVWADGSFSFSRTTHLTW